MRREEKIARALKNAKSLAGETHIVSSRALDRTDRELLLATGWLQEIIRGWYLLVRPDVAAGDTTAWYANFWDFIAFYLQDRFGEYYCLSAESSLDLHTEKSSVPRQLVVVAQQGSGMTQLPHGLSVMVYGDKKNFPEDIEKKKNINIMSLPLALCKASPSYFHNNARDAELALRALTDINALIRTIVKYDFITAAGRLAGAYEFIGNQAFAEEMIGGLKKIAMNITPSNPFKKNKPLLARTRIISPYASRIEAMWSEARNHVEKHFPKPKGLAKNSQKYLMSIDEIYQMDAYHSLSIEGYQVSDELIEKVKSKKWHPEKNENDLQIKNAMAARGYFDAFQQVKNNIAEILTGEDSAAIVEKNLQKWYQALFGPSVQAGIVPADALFGYRNDRVFIRHSIHSPPPKEALIDAMQAFFTCLKTEKHPGVRAVLGHYFFVFIHPYMDGNGRIGRFIMNTLLSEGGYPWTIVRVEHRTQYINILENTHQHFDLADFADFIQQEMYAGYAN